MRSTERVEDIAGRKSEPRRWSRPPGRSATLGPSPTGFLRAAHSTYSSARRPKRLDCASAAALGSVLCATLSGASSTAVRAAARDGGPASHDRGGRHLRPAPTGLRVPTKTTGIGAFVFRWTGSTSCKAYKGLGGCPKPAAKSALRVSGLTCCRVLIFAATIAVVARVRLDRLAVVLESVSGALATSTGVPVGLPELAALQGQTADVVCVLPWARGG